MPEKQYARGIFGQFTPSERPFDVPNGMEDNLRLIDDHLGLYTLSAPLPPGTFTGTSDGDGQIYTDGSYAVRNAGVVRSYPPRKGLRAVSVAGTESWLNTGSGWGQFSVLDTGPAAARAEAARAGAEVARDSAAALTRLKDTKALGLSDNSIPDGGDFVAPDPNNALQAYRKVSSTIANPVGEPFASAAAINMVLSTTGKNKFDKAATVAGKYFSTGGNAIATNANYRMSPWIAVTPGKTYTLSGTKPGTNTIAFYATTGAANAISYAMGKGIAPAGAAFAVFNITNGGSGDLTYDGTAQFEEGGAATTYEPFQRKVAVGTVRGALEYSQVLYKWSLNKINPAACDFVRRYSVFSKAMIADTFGIAATEPIPIAEGQWYTLSGINGLYLATAGDATTAQAGYFAAAGDTNAVDSVSFVAPATGGGAAFLVPTGLGITHVVINLRKAGDVVGATTLNGPSQMNEGELPLAYQPYQLADRLLSPLVPNSQAAPSAVLDAAAWFKFTATEGVSQGDKLPGFRKQWLARSKDLCLVVTGTSIIARTTEHATDHPQASTRPPLMHSRNTASLLWDKLKWAKQQYRRYDVAGFFTETGAGWGTSSSLAEWDDGAYRLGLTRYSGTTGAAVAFTVPIGAWQFNFIYRSDTTGVETNTVSVAEGNGKIEVLNAAGAWVEANGFTFSMREAAVVTRTVQVPSPATDTTSPMTIASKGNTTYQRRLKMRCKSGAIDSRAATKAVTITGSTAGRFMYWGVEWSTRQYMMTFINAARGSHNSDASTALGLPRFQDNEVWSFKPDVVLVEVPVINDGISAATSRHLDYWKRLANSFAFRADYELSLKTRAAFFGLAPELALFSSVISTGLGGVDNADGSLLDRTENDGTVRTTLDRWHSVAQWVLENHPETPFVHCASRWVEAGDAIFGNMQAATTGSGKSGSTFTNENSHPNDTGSKVLAKPLLPLFDYTR